MPEQEQEQELTHHYKNIFTLESGVQIEILTRNELQFELLNNQSSRKIKGFILNPLLVEKTIKIKKEAVAAFESIKNPCIAQVIPWPESEDN